MIDRHEHITERDFLAGVVNVHTVQGRPPRYIQIVHVLQSLREMTEKQVDATLAEMDTTRHRKAMRRCVQIHKRLWRIYNVDTN